MQTRGLHTVGHGIKGLRGNVHNALACLGYNHEITKLIGPSFVSIAALIDDSAPTGVSTCIYLMQN